MYNLLNTIFGIPLALAQAGTVREAAEEDQITSMVTFIVSRLPLWITAIIVLAVSLVIAFIVKKAVENRLASRIEEEHQELLIISGRISFVTVSIIGITISLAIAGIDLTSMLAALAFGISFGLQDTIANFVAGLAILASRPFTIGDFIKVNDKMGKVMEIRTRATYLKTVDGMRLIVPNAELYKSSVLSYTSNPMRRIKLPVYCRYGINLQDVMALSLKIVKQHSQILLEPKPSIVVVDMADYYIELSVRFWITKGTAWFKLKSKIFMEIHKALEEAGLDAPYPVTSLSLEEDVENAVVKTHQVDNDEMKELLTLRQRYQEELAKKKEVYVREDIPIVAAQLTPDQSGENFLRNSVQPPAPEWLKKASEGMNGTQVSQGSAPTENIPTFLPASSVTQTGEPTPLLASPEATPTATNSAPIQNPPVQIAS